MNCKYIEVSASLNHRVDELLVGIVRQIRKRQQLAQQQQDERPSSMGSPSVFNGLRRRRSARTRPSSTSSTTTTTSTSGSTPPPPLSDHRDDAASVTAVGCPEAIRAAKELLRDLFTGGGDLMTLNCLPMLSSTMSDTDCENLLEL